jgi:hypothetical protein
MSSIYEVAVRVTRQSVLCGEVEEMTSLDALLVSDIGLLREFALDDDIQYMKIVSTNIGMIREYAKTYKVSER